MPQAGTFSQDLGRRRSAMIGKTSQEEVLATLDAHSRSGKVSVETEAFLKECIFLFTSNKGHHAPAACPGLLEQLLATVIKPLFAEKSTLGSFNARYMESARKLWKDTPAWALGVLRWILNQYDTLESAMRKQVIESHIPLLVPPILCLVDDDDLEHKKCGCEFLEILCNHILDCQSDILKRKGLSRVFEDSLSPNVLLLPSLTPEDQSLEVLGRVYPAYRALINASFPPGSAPPPSKANPVTPSSSEKRLITQSFPDQLTGRQAMLDRLLRNAILAGYMHASDHVRIATLLVSELSPVIAMMGVYSTKYLSRILPLLGNILTNPLGTSYPPLLNAGLGTYRQMILQCWPRIRDEWWEECFRTMIGLWSVLSDEERKPSHQLRRDTKRVLELLVKLKAPSEAKEILELVQAENSELDALFSTG